VESGKWKVSGNFEGEKFNGKATYGKFRRFEIRTEESVEAPPR
jgi:hypothetical protein